MTDDRYSRNEGLFGAHGQRHIADTTVALVGYGGLGSIVGTELAYLGVASFRIVEFDSVERSNLNRLVGATPSDLEEPKASIAVRSISAIQAQANVIVAQAAFADNDAQKVVADADVIFGCVDSDPVRVEILGWAASQRLPYIDAATDIVKQDDGTLAYGGRVVVTTGKGCPLCLDVLDQQELATTTMTHDQRAAHARIYGINADILNESGPSVIPINGVVASLAVTEFMVLVTGLRSPVRLLTYRADRGGVIIDRTEPKPDCYYCTQYRAASD